MLQTCSTCMDAAETCKVDSETVGDILRCISLENRARPRSVEMSASRTCSGRSQLRRNRTGRWRAESSVDFRLVENRRHAVAFHCTCLRP